MGFRQVEEKDTRDRNSSYVYVTHAPDQSTALHIEDSPTLGRAFTSEFQAQRTEGICRAVTTYLLRKKTKGSGEGKLSIDYVNGLLLTTKVCRNMVCGDI